MKSFAHKGFRVVATGLLLVAVATVSGCLTPENAVAEVDREAYDAIGGKQQILHGAPRAFAIDPHQHRIMATVIDPETGLTLTDASLALDLATVLEVAAVNSRTFQQQKESLFRAALSLMQEREQFHNIPFGTFDGAATSSGGAESIAGDTEFGVTRLLKNGGSYAVSLGLDFLRFVSSPTSETFGSFLNFSLSLPFLRNAGREIATENLIQADRDLLYALRDFERFKQTFGVQVVTSYFNALTQKERIEIATRNLASLKRAREEVEERFREGRVSRVELDQNLQAELDGENSVINATQGLEASLDGLKDLIGLPVDLPVTVKSDDLAALDALLEEESDIEEVIALKAAFRNRLDFRNVVEAVVDAGRRVHVAENALKPDFTLDLSAAPVSKNLKPLKYNYKDGTYIASFDLDFALDRHLESISLRATLIDLQVALRNQEDSREGIKLEVRSALRAVRQARENYRITKSGLELARRRVDSTKELRLVGRASTRDFLESQDSLVRSENDLVDTKVDYRIAFLEFFRDTGALVVTPGGLDHETSRDLLDGK